MVVLAHPDNFHDNVTMAEAPKPFAAYDLDGTLFKSSVLEKSIPIAVDLGVFRDTAFDDAYASREHWQQDNNEGTYLAYTKKLVDSFIGQMANTRVDAFDEVVKELVSSQLVRRYGFTKRLIGSVAATHSNILITGSPEILARPFVQDMPGISRVFGSTYEAVDGVYTGVARSVGSKAAILQSLVTEGSVSQQNSIAVGDTMSDTPMLHMATSPIAFNPSFTLAQYGQEYGWDKAFEVKDNITPLHLDENTGSYVEVPLAEYLDSLRKAA
jgi:HAD superfamily phosphoserine phosphatase-like hydrolase